MSQAKAGHLHSVQFCLATDKGALATLAPDGESVCHFAAGSGNVALMKLLLRERSKRTPYQQRQMWTTVDGWTPVHNAAAAGHTDLVHLFAESGIDLAPVSSVGATPADIARVRLKPTFRKRWETHLPSSLRHEKGGWWWWVCRLVFRVLTNQSRGICRKTALPIPPSSSH